MRVNVFVAIGSSLPVCRAQAARTSRLISNLRADLHPLNAIYRGNYFGVRTPTYVYFFLSGIVICYNEF